MFLRVPGTRERAGVRVRASCLGGHLLLACGGDPRAVAERAEPRPEPAAIAAGLADPPGAMVIEGDLRLWSGATIGPRTFEPALARAGGLLRVRFLAAGLAGTALRLSLRAPQAAGRQEAIGQTTRPKGQVTDPRDRSVEVVGGAGEAWAELPVPTPWHAGYAVIVAEVAGDPAVAGPRRADGAAILGVVPVAPEPTRVSAPRAEVAVVVDGRLDEAVWAGQAGTVLTESQDGEPDPQASAAAEAGTLGALEASLGTRVAFAWDAEHLYAAADLPDEDLWSEYTRQDEPLYKQEAFELFVAATNSGRRYLEYQVSARGVTFDARFPRYRAGEEAWDSSWRTAARAEGTLDGPRDRDRGFAVEVAIPWAELCAETELVCPPRAGMQLRVNAFRLEHAGRRRAIGLSLSPTRAPDFHAWDNAAVLVLM